MIYLDNAATSFQKPREVTQAVQQATMHLCANPGRGGHKLSIAAGDVLYDCRESLADLFHIKDPARIIFCPNTTFALNTAIKGVLTGGGHAVTSSMEHNSVLRPLEELRSRQIAQYTVVRADQNGEMDYDEVERAIRPDTRLLVCTHASNVCGNVYDVKRLSAIARRNNVLFCLDAAQSAGILDIDAQDVDLLAFPGHKGLLGPQGSGGLYIADGVMLSTLVEGGTGSRSESYVQPDILPDRFESGTQNVAAAAGLAAGVNFILHKGIKNIHDYETALADRLRDNLLNIPGVRIYGGKERVGVIAMNLEGMDCVELCNRLDSEYGIAVRGGLHCSILAHETLGTQDVGCARFSVGCFNTRQEIERASLAVKRIAGR